LLTRLSGRLIDILKAPDLVERFAKVGVELVGSKPDAFRAHVAAEIRRLERAVRATGVTLE
jgi:tripartite-type tricarboxylate transporter receptor subunit TctC